MHPTDTVTKNMVLGPMEFRAEGPADKLTTQYSGIMVENRGLQDSGWEKVREGVTG